MEAKNNYSLKMSCQQPTRDEMVRFIYQMITKSRNTDKRNLTDIAFLVNRVFIRIKMNMDIFVELPISVKKDLLAWINGWEVRRSVKHLEHHTHLLSTLIAVDEKRLEADRLLATVYKKPVPTPVTTDINVIEFLSGVRYTPNPEDADIERLEAFSTPLIAKFN